MTRRVTARLAAAACVSALAAGVLSAAAAPKLTFTDTKLKNGLRVIIHEDHTAPVFSIAVTYNAGSRDERAGRTGFAHLFEHMMFKGSENIGPGEHFLLVFNNGGSMNGTTDKDRTLYYETLPSNQLDLGLYLEADRMASLEITKANLDNQRNAVQEERRQGVDNQPYGKTFEAFDELAFDGYAYKHSVIGSMADLTAASVEDVASFFKTYYAPNNAVLAISGDVNAADTLAKVKKYFERIPAQPAPAAVELGEKPQTAERRLVLEDAMARLSRLDIGYKIPALGSKDDEALSVLSTVLSSGRSSRLYESVVRQKQLSTGVGAGPNQERGVGLFRFTGTLAPGKSMADLEAALWEEIEKVKKGPIADWEIEKARNQARRNLVGTLQSSLSRAILLSQDALYFNDPGRINTRPERIAAVTAADVQRVATMYLVPERRTVVITNPKPAAPRGGVQ
ncbi:MAG: insulinase family protein [Acidobacteriota bacterium]|nr:insulinase family protein [Acidobacteriota bacterium]